MESLLPLTSWAFVMAITPGPGNILLASSGVSFGFVRTLPLLFGIFVGYSHLLALCGVGVGALIMGEHSKY